MNTIEKIFTRMVSNNTLVCCGLDPDLTKIPFEITEKNISDEDKVYEFLHTVINITAPHVCVFKAQKAFFDLLPGGHEVLRESISYIHETHPEIPVILDCKIGDVENTMSIYIKNIFGNLKADGIVANPYMGNDTIIPLAELRDKAIVVLVQTSNPTAAVIQDIILQNGRPLWKHILDILVNRWNYNNNMIPVLSANSTWNLSEIRKVIPNEMIILLAGIGAQGGNYTNLCNLLNANNVGAFVNSSRGILYQTESQKPWNVAIEESVIQLKNKLNIEGGRNE